MKLVEKEPKYICNNDQVGLTYLCSPRRSYLATHEDYKEAHSSEVMRRKSRLTIVAFSSAHWSYVSSKFFIGYSKRPNCLDLSTSEDAVDKW